MTERARSDVDVVTVVVDRPSDQNHNDDDEGGARYKCHKRSNARLCANEQIASQTIRACVRQLSEQRACVFKRFILFENPEKTNDINFGPTACERDASARVEDGNVNVVAVVRVVEWVIFSVRERSNGVALMM